MALLVVYYIVLSGKNAGIMELISAHTFSDLSEDYIF